ncbi:MAG: DUF1127 domain-containing protein [Pseudomonadota bacterium]
MTNAKNSGFRTRGSLISVLVRAHSVWRQRRALSRLDAAALKDIGVTPEEAGIEARRSPWDAPETWRF